MKDKPHYGLEKLPPEAVIKQLRFELGVITSERDEAIYQTRKLKSKVNVLTQKYEKFLRKYHMINDVHNKVCKKLKQAYSTIHDKTKIIQNLRQTQ